MMVASIVQGFHWRLIPLLHNHHTSSLKYRPCCEHLSRGRKDSNTPFRITNDDNTIQPWGIVWSGQPNVAMQCHLHPVKRCIIVWLLMICLPCGRNAMNHMNCLLVIWKRGHQHCYCIVRNEFSIVARTGIRIMMNLVCEAGISFELPSNVILHLPLWHCTPLGQVMKDLDLWWWVLHHLLDKCFC